MPGLALTITIVWTVLLLAATAVGIVRAKTLAGRILAFDTFSMVLIAVLAAFAILRDDTTYLDAAIAVALLSFSGTVAAARYVERWSLR